MIDTEKIVAITHAEYLSDYRVRLHFNDGKEQILNFESFLRHARNPMYIGVLLLVIGWCVFFYSPLILATLKITKLVHYP